MHFFFENWATYGVELRIYNIFNSNNALDTLIFKKNTLDVSSGLTNHVIQVTTAITNLIVQGNYCTTGIRRLVFNTTSGHTYWNISNNTYLRTNGDLLLNVGTLPTNLKVINNEGYVTSNHGTASVQNSSTIAHGLVATPTEVNIVSQNKDRVISATVDASNITLEIIDTGGANVTTNFDVFWSAKVYHY